MENDFEDNILDATLDNNKNAKEVVILAPEVQRVPKFKMLQILVLPNLKKIL
mgnify:FL=1